MDDGGVEDRVRALPRRVTAMYALVSAAWIVASDLAVATAVDQPLLVNISKGLLFVAVTSVLLHQVLRRLAGQIAHEVAARESVARRHIALVEHQHDIIAVVADGRVASINRAVQRVLGQDPADLVGRPVEDLVHLDDLAVARGRSEEDWGPPGLPTVIRLRHVDGSWRSLQVTIADHRDDPAIGGVVIVAHDVTDRLLAERQLHWAQTHDVLTGLPNRTEFELQAAAILQRDGGNAHGSAAVVVADLDRFRRINATMGRRTGDRLLREVAERLRLAAPGAAALGRLGGADFGLLVVVPDRPSPRTQITQLMERVRDAVAEPMGVRGTPVRLSMSLGAALSVGGQTAVSALTRAEIALAEAKLHPDRIALAPDRALAPPAVLAGLHDALHRDDLVLHVQPQRLLRTGEVVGVEGLMRWQHPERGLLLPAEFLDVAAAEGLMPEVTRSALRQGAALARHLQDAGHPLQVSINLSLQDLSRRGLVAEAGAAVEAAGIPASRLRLELTEQALLVHPDTALQTLHALRAMGFTFSIDDFGTGYSSLAHLRLLPVQELKVDRSFVVRLDDPVTRAIVASICRMGRELGMNVVAEGVEDDAAVADLVEMGCDVGQSFHLGRPVPVGDLLAELAGPSAD